MLGVGGAKKTYMDDLFSTYLWAGSGSGRSINNGINLSGEGGMVWIKNRTWGTNKHVINDTVRGHSNAIMADETDVNTTQAGLLDAFNSNGFDVSTDNFVNGSSQNYASWSFRRASGFFDVVTYTGNGSARTIAHSLGSIPGLIMIKKTNGSTDWNVYHRETGSGKKLILNTNAAEASTFAWNNVTPTSTNFTLGVPGEVNANGDSYVAYVFAGGESTNTLARSVDLDGDDYLNTTTASSDFVMGTGDFTIECWAKPNANSSDQPLFHISDTSGGFQGSSNYGQTVWHRPGGNWVFTTGNGVESEISGYKPAVGVWYHMALVRNSGTTTLYINGRKINSATDTTDYIGTYIVIGGYHSTSYIFDGKISNFRVVKGTAVYTSSFRPPTEPLTNITNTKLLCCNNSSVTGSTVTPVTINSNGNPSASTDSPFDDPAAFTFGANEDQNVIKCGSYVGNGNADGPEIFLGWEPQWVMIKASTSSSDEHWRMLDSMRGVVTNGNDADLSPSKGDAESSSADLVSLTATGFKLVTTTAAYNEDAANYIYMAIRRSDGYVGKPLTATDVFAMDTGNSNANQGFTSGFPVDYAFYKKPASSHNWYSHSRLTGTGFQFLDVGNQVEQSNSYAVWDDMTGWAENTLYNSDYQSWMWKRHAGFDLVTTVGGSGKLVPHNLGGVPEMIWLKARDSSQDWKVYHHGVNGGTNPEQYGLNTDANGAQNQNQGYWNNVAPTATHFSTGTWTSAGGSSSANYMMMLFRSITGVSKCGYYDGQNTTITLTTGFAPRFLIIKRVTGADSWLVFDTTRGWGSGNDYRLILDTDTTQSAPVDYGAPTSTGFTMTTRDATNASGEKYIYYAHA